MPIISTFNPQHLNSKSRNKSNPTNARKNKFLNLIKYNNFTCYFDASTKNNKSGCSFTILFNNEILYEETKAFFINKSHQAEKQSLHNLLKYINIHFPIGTNFDIYGDNLHLIQSLDNHDPTCEVNLLYNKLLKKFTINIIHINRELNSYTDDLAYMGMLGTKYKKYKNKLILININKIKTNAKPLTKKQFDEWLSKELNNKNYLPKIIKLDKHYNLIEGHMIYSIMKFLNIHHCVTIVSIDNTI